ncbi:MULTISPECIES: immunity 49 family protein [unclassified Streptomyces]|uniref:immunity 49 family protein n=1 Tax=unclassified Streptomyces TaxID=2593676 RepID=UPI002E36F7F4|nr:MULTISPECIES: immunity 49 family protein [unclassified Streptomyces]WUC66142.1 immunity 49 family protein [Streptomyces sp. NBC_00539]
MTTIVSRHFASPGPTEEEWAESLGEDLADDIDRLERRPHALGRVFNNALLHLGARCTVDPRAAKLETWEAVVNALQVGSAIFATASATEGTVECRINRQIRTLPATGADQGLTDLGTWLTTFWLAVVCRDQVRITELARFPLDRLHDGGFDEFVRHWVDTLQTYWLQGPDLVAKLTRAVEMSTPGIAVQAPRELLEAVLAPPINLFYLFITQNAVGFNEALVQALELHKAYWTADEKRVESPGGHLALAPLAIACFAFDGKMPVEVESGYLPHHLLTRGWLGEFPT